jgi:hypothetical protein
VLSRSGQRRGGVLAGRGELETAGVVVALEFDPAVRQVGDEMRWRLSLTRADTE